ncbi:MAG: BTAD domain-containing putative transcriptional regulator [Candidatus Dormibacteria bacterium]
MAGAVSRDRKGNGRASLSSYHSEPDCLSRPWVGSECTRSGHRPLNPEWCLVSEERVKPRSLFVDEAISLALESRWAEALAVNQALVERHGADEDTLNRIGKALTELGRREEALASYSGSLQINPLNLIAQKNVRKLTAMLESKSTAAGSAAAIDVELFTEEPGKSAITVLSAPSKSATVAIAPGDVVELYREGSTLRAQTSRGVSLGEVDTKIARRLVPLMETGNRYSAAVARLEDERVEIILRETYQAAENARKSSFPLAKGGRREEFRPYAKESLLASREIDSTPLDDDGEELLGRPADDAEDDLGELGMSTFQSDAEETPPGLETDDDDDARPEDEY